MTRVAIIGTAGVPASYGGFETLADNLVRFHSSTHHHSQLVVYCSGKAGDAAADSYLSAELRYVPLSANGISSILYDAWSLLSECRRGGDVLLVLGVSGAITFPLIRWFAQTKIIVNVDGIEWKRQKWSWSAKRLLRFFERMAVRYADVVIADNAAIAEYLQETYACEAEVIAYGGDHAVAVAEVKPLGLELPERYALSICRIEPENNLDLILGAFAEEATLPLVLIGNWSASRYGRELRNRYQGDSGVFLVDPIYDVGQLKYVRSRACLYVHGHSAGGTNPSLVEAMHFGAAIAAFDCPFNRHTMADLGFYFGGKRELLDVVRAFAAGDSPHNGEALQQMAMRLYSWEIIGKRYFQLIEGK